MAFHIAAGKWDEQEENCKFCDSAENFSDAIEMLLDVNTYPWARIEAPTLNGGWNIETLLWAPNEDELIQGMPDFTVEPDEGAEHVFTINNQRYVAYWLATKGVKHAFSL